MELAVLNIDFIVIQAAGRNVILGIPYHREASLNKPGHGEHCQLRG